MIAIYDPHLEQQVAAGLGFHKTMGEASDGQHSEEGMSPKALHWGECFFF